ncbi:YEATS domain-containing protein 2 isoform X7 [Varanus komodoensis]|uniref:YEATS domain-containing protein 2 isoform X7 n=1 Tax=Varanus komodoensis TaxID=61221 RepID=UPI001CF7B61D|nr:YEATS domain-containing protein 2 isoform X7 [Varanus komodoensis]
MYCLVWCCFLLPEVKKPDMSGIKRTLEEMDPDYEEISVAPTNKRHKAAEQSARDAAVLKIEAIIKEQFSVEMKNKEHEIEVIDQRLIEARRMMDKLRACIVANYYASAALLKVGEGTKACDPMVFNHPSIKKFLESPSRSSSPANQGSETLSVNHSESESSQHTDYMTGKDNGNLDAEERLSNKHGQRLSKNSGQGTSAVARDRKLGMRNTGLSNEEYSRLFVKKTIVVGNVSKYIPPDMREENDQSTHKWMVYVRGSRREPSIDHFVKKVWFFLHPSYKPNDLVEVREPPFHLTRRGWGEFPVRIQIHFKDSRNKRIDIIHHLKLDRTYTGLQTLGAETVVDVELHRHSLREEYLFSQSSDSDLSDAPNSLHLPLNIPAPVKASSPIKPTHESIPDASAEKGSPISTPSPSPLPRTPTSTPVHMKQGTATPVVSNPYVIVDKPGQPVGVVTTSAGSPAAKVTSISQAPQGTGSPVSKIHGSSFAASAVKQEDSLFATMPPLCPIGSHSKVQSPKAVTGGPGTFTKVIIKQEPGELPQPSPAPAAGTASQTSVQQYVTVKGSHVIALSPQKQIVSTGEGSTSAKIVSVPVGSALPTSVKQAVAIGGGQILVAKSSPSVAKTVGGKQVVTQGVAKAIVSGGGGTIVAQPVQTLTKAQVPSAGVPKSGSQGSVMATLQLPATNLANLANLPPGTKLYLTTNSKNPSGKGKLLLIPQGAILRATNNANQQSGTSAGGGGGTQSTSTGLSQHLTYTSYILKQTPQGTFLVGQPSHQTSAKQAATGTVVQGNTSAGTSSQGHQALKVITGHKTAALFAQAASSGQASLMKISDNTLKSLPASSQLSKPGTTVLRVSGGVITAATTSAMTPPSNGIAQVRSSVGQPACQASNAGTATQQADSASSSLVPAASPAVKASGQQHQVPINPGQAASAVPNKTSASAVVSIASWVTAPAPVSGKTAVSGLLKIHSSQNSPQQAVLTVPSQLKQLGVSTASGGVQTILMPVNKVIQSLSSSKVSAATPVTSANPVVPSPSVVSVTKVKLEPDSSGQSCSSQVSQETQMTVKAEESSELGNYVIGTEYLDNLQQLLTAIVKKVPLIAERTEDANSFCASSVEQYYSWNIGKRRAAEWQRALTVRKILQEMIEKHPKFHSIVPLKTKQVVHWCRYRGYTPPDPEALRNEDSIEDVLTQIDSEPECSSSYTTGEEICRKLVELERLLKQEPDNDEEVDILGITEPLKMNIKKEQEEKQTEAKLYLTPQPASEFVRKTVQQIGISLQPIEVQKNIYASVIEDMILKATEQLANDILREALAVGYQAAPRHRTPREITVMNIHQAICNIPFLDFLTNKHMGILNDEQ